MLALGLPCGKSCNKLALQRMIGCLLSAPAQSPHVALPGTRRD